MFASQGGGARHALLSVNFYTNQDLHSDQTNTYTSEHVVHVAFTLLSRYDAHKRPHIDT